MNRLIVALLLTSTVARAQPGLEVALDVFLEQRVAEELAADGTILSRLGVALDVELVGDKAIISLVDLAARRPVASTKIDALPADREAAVASTVQVVAALAAQVSTSTSASVAAIQTMLEQQREERRARDEGEMRYRQSAIWFGDHYDIWVTGYRATVTRNWVAYQGEARRHLEPQDFYRTVGHPELADQYRRSRIVGTTLIVGAIGVSIASFVAMTAMFPDPGACLERPDDNACYDRQDDELRRASAIGGAGVLVGAGMFLYGWYRRRNSHPISEGAAADLATKHNTEVRKKLGLPTGAALAPYAGPRGGGLALTGRF